MKKRISSYFVIFSLVNFDVALISGLTKTADAKKIMCNNSGAFCVIYDNEFCNRTARQVTQWKQTSAYKIAVQRQRDKKEDPMNSTTYRNVQSGLVGMKMAGCKVRL